MEKVCGICGVSKPLENFARKGKSTQSYCKACRKIWFAAHYKENKAYYINKAKEKNEKLKQWWHDFKLTLKCSKCGFSHPAALDFHHKDPVTKTFDVSRAVVIGVSKKKILNEIAKCEVLCANCHRIEHYNR